ncbi:GntR family transcriptional regulator [Clostridium sp. ASF356]|nr:GntR family transcriptional regulator [Clostridium sp. MD294]NDO47504.1 GntR family transcriptional regulator [Clostridium sp. MD294]
MQIIMEMKIRIVSGKLAAGEKIASVRELAQEFEVNPNTMQRALSEMERENLFYTERTSGRFVTTDEGIIMTLRNRLAEQELQKFMGYMEQIGYSKKEIIQKIETWQKERKNNE